MASSLSSNSQMKKSNRLLLFVMSKRYYLYEVGSYFEVLQVTVLLFLTYRVMTSVCCKAAPLYIDSEACQPTRIFFFFSYIVACYNYNYGNEMHGSLHL